MIESIAHKRKLFEFSRRTMGTILLVTILFFTTTVTVTQLLERYRKSQLEEIITSRQELVVERIEEWAQARKNAIKPYLEDVNSQRIVRDLLQHQKVPLTRHRSAAQQELRLTLTPQIVSGGFLGYFILSPDLTNIASMRDRNLDKTNLLADQKRFFNKLAEGQIALSSIINSDVPLPDERGILRDGLPTMFVGKAFFNETGDVIAYFLARIPAHTALSELLHIGRIGLSGESYLVDSTGRMLSDSLFENQLRQIGLLGVNQHSALNINVRDPGINLIETGLRPQNFNDLPLTKMAQSLTAGETGSNWHGYNDYRGIPVIGAWQWIDDLNVGITTEIDVHEAFEEWRNTQLALWIAAATGYLMVVLYLLVNERNTRALRLREEYLRTVMDSSGDGIIVIDQNSIIKTINRSAAHLFGYNQTELLEKDISILLPDEYRKMHPRLVASAELEEGQRVLGDRQLYGQHKSGEHIPLEINISPLQSGPDRMFIGMVRDVSERLEAEKKINHFKQAMDSAFDCILMFKPDTLNIVYANAGATALTGYAQEELLHMGVVDLKLGTNHETLIQSLKVLTGGRVSRQTFRAPIVCKDNAQLITEVSLQLVEDENYESVYLAFIRDISAERKAAEAITRREKILRSVLDNSVAHIALLDHEGRIFEVNEAWNNFFTRNAHPDENGDVFIGTPYQDVRFSTPPSNAGSNIERGGVIQRILKGELASWEHVSPCHTPTQRRWLKVFCRRVEGVEDIGCIVTHFDVSEIIHTQEKLKLVSQEATDANEAKSRFLATMSHEIRTPMNGIVGMIDLLQESDLSSEQRNMASTVRTSAYSLLAIINDILDLSKIESGNMELEEIPVSISDILETVGEMLWVGADRKGVSLYLQPDLSGPERVLTDPTRLRQIILNLTNNAIKFSSGLDHTGKVHLSSHFYTDDKGETRVKIMVADNGIGMTTKQIERIFHPFTQADNSTTRQFGGTGLGLTICHNLTETMQGRISVTSDPGEGTCFTVDLPVNEAPQAREKHLNLPELDDLDFILFHNKINELDDIICESVRARHGHIKTVQDLTELEALLRTHHNNKQIGLIFVGDRIDTGFMNDLQAVYQKFSAHPLKVLGLSRDPSGKKGVVGDNHFVIGCHPLLPSSLVWGCAILAGRASPLTEIANEDIPLHDIASQTPSTIEEAAKSGQLILVAEDHEINRAVIRRQLNRLGYACEMAHDGEEALKMLREKDHYALLLTDCHMPQMDGFTLTKAIRTHEKGQALDAHLPIIAITANALVGEADRCFAAGMDDYLAKPVELSQLKYTLQKWLGKQTTKTSESVREGVTKKQEITPPDPEANSDDTPFDFDMLQRLLGSDDPDFIQEMLAYYWDAAQKDKQAIEEAFQDRNQFKLGDAAHAAKGGAHSAGAVALGDALFDLQEAARSSDWDAIQNSYPKVTSEFNKVASWLTRQAS